MVDGDTALRNIRRVLRSRFFDYSPYDWQRGFHDAGKEFSERMLMAANRVGKTMSAATEVAYHLTGDYPEWWSGKRFDTPTLVWTGSPTNESSREIVQKELLGGIGEDLGSGVIPIHKIAGKPRMRQAGVSDVVDVFKVKHKEGVSTCVLKTYEQGWQKWQGTAPHVVWLDEEPDDYMIFSEAQTRILSSDGVILVTFTPLLGMTDLVTHFMDDNGSYLKTATWDDAPHLDEKKKAGYLRRYRAHEVDARTKGIPMMGEAAVFPIPENSIKCDPFAVPSHFARIKGVDFGVDHPAAGACVAWDRDNDVIYLYDCYRKSGETSVYHAAWLNKSESWVPVSWPHDGMNREKSGGETIAQAYLKHGVNMLGKSARYPKQPGEAKAKGGAQPQWPVIDELRERMLTERFKVFGHLNAFFEEYRSYHVKDGKIVPVRDDILKALFYAVMMKRYATTAPIQGYEVMVPEGLSSRL